MLSAGFQIKEYGSTDLVENPSRAHHCAVERPRTHVNAALRLRLVQLVGVLHP